MPAQPVVPRTWAVVGSVLAVGTAVGTGHLVAGLVSPLSSPYQAVADAVVRLAPAALVEFGKSLALPGLPQGRADKFGLLLGVGVALLLVAVLAGLASRRSPRPGRWVLIALGLVGLAAVVSSPVFTLPDVVAPLASMGAGVWTFRFLHERALALAVVGDNPAVVGDDPAVVRDDDPAVVGDDPAVVKDDPGGGGAEVSRRRLLVSSAAVGVGAAGAGIAGSLLGAGVDVSASQSSVATMLRPTQPAAPLPAGADFAGQGTPTFLTANQDFYRIDTALRLPARAA
ncbi:MAG TPA: hypothetical protein VNP03_14965, partial [Pseudonocardia sp.]|nr:hypothetical protein [Pseudonocardia sp.]